MLDRQDSKLIKFMTCSPAGGLPLGFLITSSENETTLTEAFTLFKDVLPDYAFCKRGQHKGPVLFMTDDADAEINALKKVWPESKFLLCVWHVLNAVWRWLWLGDHQIKKDDRPYLLNFFRDILYANKSGDYEKCKTDFLSDDICLKYPKYIQHLQKSYFGRSEVWTISARNDQKLPTHSTNTSNYVEASFRLTKDGQFNRTKAYNLLDLLDILLDDSVYYQKRLLDIGNGRFGALKNGRSKYLLKECSITAEKISDIGETNLIVESESNDMFYEVNMVTGFCECQAGNNCGPCKHKQAITKHKGITEFTVLPEIDSNMRAMYHFIAENTVCKSTWYRNLENPDVIESVEEFVQKRIEAVPIESVQTTHPSNDDENISPNESMESEESDDEIDLENFVTAMDAFKNKVKQVYNKDMKKGVKHFTKKLINITKGNMNTLKQSLFSIGREMSSSKSGVKKKKKGKQIPIQVTAKSRRQYKHRGRGVGILGRRPKDQEKRQQMIITNEGDNV